MQKKIADSKTGVAVILVMYRQKHNLDLLYKTLSSQSYNNIRIYFVDNNPDDEDLLYSKKLNRNYFLDIDYLQTGYNAGFAAGNNAGAKKAIADGFNIIFFLNNDNELDNDCINILASELRKRSDAGAASPLILFGADKRNEDIIQEFGEKCDFKKYRITKNYGQKYLKEVEEDLPVVLKCDLLSGGAVMFKKDALEKTGPWEESYFAYGDEIDMFRRLHEKGFSAIALSPARLYHHHNWNRNNKQSYYFEYYLIERNKFLYFHKFRLYGAMFLMFVTDTVKFPRRLLWFVKVCDLKLGLYYIRGMFAGLLNRKGKPGFDFIK